MSYAGKEDLKCSLELLIAANPGLPFCGNHEKGCWWIWLVGSLGTDE